MKTLPKLMFEDGDTIREFRKKMGVNQHEFWRRIGITQSGGSRYESGRKIPLTIKMLLHIAYGHEHRVERLVTALRSDWKAAPASSSRLVAQENDDVTQELAEELV